MARYTRKDGRIINCKVSVIVSGLNVNSVDETNSTATVDLGDNYLDTSTSYIGKIERYGNDWMIRVSAEMRDRIVGFDLDTDKGRKKISGISLQNDIEYRIRV